MRRIHSLLSDALGRDEVLRAARAQRVLRQWSQVVGAELAKRSRPDKYDRGTVWVAVEGSAWAQELRMIRDVILNKLRESAGDPTLFADVRFGVRPLDRGFAELPQEEPDEPLPLFKEALSIREIAERRLKLWANEDGAQR